MAVVTILYKYFFKQKNLMDNMKYGKKTLRKKVKRETIITNSKFYSVKRFERAIDFIYLFIISM